jgi:hypothetical protein
MTRQEIIGRLKGIYQTGPSTGSRWLETSDIEEAVDTACVRGHAWLNDYVITWTEHGTSADTGYGMRPAPEARR